MSRMAWRFPKPVLWGAAIVIIVAVAVVYVSRQGVGSGIAMSAFDGRPELLSDAEWGKSGSARRFEQRFSPGSREADLLAWLEGNHFAVDRRSGRANRRVESLPCNERIEVAWAANPAGRIARATALVSEAGCL